MQNIVIENKLIVIFLWLAILLYPLLFIWQGGDLTDTGFFALTYQNFFTNLHLGKINGESFLSDLIGATWVRSFPNLGIIGLNFLYLIFFYPLVLVTYNILKVFSEKKVLILFGILCGVAFSERATHFVFSRDVCSLLFLIVSSHFLILGLSGRKFFIFISGLIFALACFSRLPNVVFIIILPLIFFYKFLFKEKIINRTNLWLIIKEYSLFILGFITLLFVFSGVLNYFNLNKIFISNLELVFTQNQNSYSFLDLLKSYISECIVFVPHALIVVLLMITTSLVYNYSKVTKKKVLFLFYILLVFCFAFYSYRDYSYTSAIKYLVPAFCLPPLLLSLFNKDKFSTAALVLLTVTITQVAGSNTGLFYKLCYGFLALLPLSLLILIEEKNIIFKNITVNTKIVFALGSSIILLFSLFARIGWIYHVDSGMACRLRATYPIENQLMKGILTTKNNADYIKELCSAIESNITADNTLIIYGHQPMFYYLTKQPPPVKKFWLVNNFVQVDEFFLSIKESIKISGKWPMIVDTKQRIMGETGEIELSTFLNDNNYVLIVRNKDFNIWKSQEVNPELDKTNINARIKLNP